MSSLLFTQSYRESGFKDLIAIGVVYAYIHIAKEKGEAIQRIREEFSKDGIEFIFNCVFQFSISGHPNNGEFSCFCFGDAYRNDKGD